jgi:transcriptional regulator with XRE-family HTH domain
MSKKAKRKTKVYKGTTRSTGPLDLHFGEKLRARRLMMKLSQAALGDAIGVTFQQIQKYEKGSNRISAAVLLLMARFFKVDISYFFEEAP